MVRMYVGRLRKGNAGAYDKVYCECEFPILMVLVCIHAMWCDTAVRKPSINSEFEFVVLL